MAYLATTFVVIVGATVIGASPARAGSWTDCPYPTGTSGYVCLWEGANYSGGRWQATKLTLTNGQSGDTGNCYNLNGSSYTNGNPVRDTASSWAIRKSDPYVYQEGFQVRFYEWINCNTSGNYRTYEPNLDYAVSNLATLTPSWDNTVASIRVLEVDYNFSRKRA